MNKFSESEKTEIRELLLDHDMMDDLQSIIYDCIMKRYGSYDNLFEDFVGIPRKTKDIVYLDESGELISKTLIDVKKLRS